MSIGGYKNIFVFPKKQTFVLRLDPQFNDLIEFLKDDLRSLNPVSIN